MKQIIIIVGTIVIIFIAAMTIVSVESKDLRTDELNRAVSASIKKTVSDSQIENQSTILSDKEMVAYFIQLLSVNMKGKGDVTVEVYDADYKEGLLSVAVTEKFKYVNGKNVVIEEEKQERKKNYSNVISYVKLLEKMKEKS